MRHVELKALAAAGDRDAADLDGRSRTTAPSCPAGALRVTAMLISSMTTLELFTDDGTCTAMRAG
jgi:hypothetical protein